MLRNTKGFTVLEMIIVMTIIGTLMGAMAPKLVANAQRQAVGKEIGKNMAMLIDASKRYYMDHISASGVNKWPGSLAALKNGNYINPDWNGNHMLGGAFELDRTAAPPNLVIKVTGLPADVQDIVRMSAPGWSYSLNTYSGQSSLPPPGMEATMDAYVKKAGDSMTGDLVMKPNPDTNTPTGVVVRNTAGQNRMYVGMKDGVWGVHAKDGNGDINVRADSTMGSGEVRLQGKKVRVQNPNGDTVMTIDESGNVNLVNGTDSNRWGSVTAKDVTLKDFNNAKLSDNSLWIAHAGYYGDGEVIDLATTTEVKITGAVSYHPYVLPAVFEGANSNDTEVYPINSVKAWLDPQGVGPPYTKWTVRFKVQDALGNIRGDNTSGMEKTQWVFVLILAQMK